MRVLLAAVVATALTGCASTPTTDQAKVYDHRYNTYRSVAKSQSDFVGTSATASDGQSAWYTFGHP
jgi:hypothetical protein